MDAEARRRAEEMTAALFVRLWIDRARMPDEAVKNLLIVETERIVADAVAQAVRDCPSCIGWQEAEREMEVALEASERIRAQHAEEIARLTRALVEKEQQIVRLAKDIACTSGSAIEQHLRAQLAEAHAALAEIEGRALFHPDAAWPDELKAQLRAINKLAHAALLPPPASTSPSAKSWAEMNVPSENPPASGAPKEAQ